MRQKLKAPAQKLSLRKSKGRMPVNRLPTNNKSKKQRYCIFFVNLEPASNNKEAFNIKRICHSVVTVEPPLKFDDVMQCYPTILPIRGALCKMRTNAGKNDPALCLHCKGDHAASYKGCPAYKKAKNLAAPRSTRTQYQANRVPTGNPLPSVRTNFSYADAARGCNNSENNQVPQSVPTPENQLDAVVLRMESMMERMLDKMFSEMTNMTTVMSKLCK
ncbi:titin-like [Drosophila madeirensis]